MKKSSREILSFTFIMCELCVDRGRNDDNDDVQ